MTGTTSLPVARIWVSVWLVAAVWSLRWADPAAALNCAAPTENAACTSNEECGCGVASPSAQCVVGAAECITADPACNRFCSGPYGTLTSVCRQGTCTRGRPTSCPADCDADTNVGVPELVTGVAIMLGQRPQSACDGLDADDDGALRIDEMMDGVRAALQGCAAVVPRDPTRRGTYDATLTGTDGPFAGTYSLVGEANVQEEAGSQRLSLSLDLRPNRGINLYGTLVAGTASLTGNYYVTDYGHPLIGTATIADSAEEDVISGTVHGRIAEDDLEASFVMRRSHLQDPARFSGRYRFESTSSPSEAPGPSSFTALIAVGADGYGLMSEAVDVGSGDQVLGTLTSGQCFIAPRGHLFCRTMYLVAGSPESVSLRFTGALVEDGPSISGDGAFLAGVDPPHGPQPYVSGGWSAQRRLIDQP